MDRQEIARLRAERQAKRAIEKATRHQRALATAWFNAWLYGGAAVMLVMLLLWITGVIR